jgi:predicted HicB family RNase H-like nuclease
MKFKNVPVPSEVHKAIKSEAANQETTMYNLIAEMFKIYIEQKDSDDNKN